ncbi:Cytochrome P450 monooxygenase orf6 [Colletotrichum siamense]|uniref:Cytochrome P450 monooxygenase orf6 n=1 Tax=Colletotrichum siamense TaxID=690259 RepID=A0A9P5EJX2_COLSI|nr:Cytochrome P450 monooxygenase orf6 [Colletotrichum siamense]KAF4852130.1 Cytochrome P450 monooxygenase orf6 [Colletotrichum siamense]
MVSFTAFGGVIVLYWVCLAIYRLYLSPLAKVPGPKIAALTSWYAAYHDIWRGGQYVWVVEEMHRQYGPVVRTMPDVVHVNDPSFVDKLYPAQSPRARRERAETVLGFFGQTFSVLPTRDHDLHRRRRAVLSRFFSKENVRRLAPIINETLGDLLRRMEGWSRTDEPIDFNPASRAATKDVIQSYALGEGEKRFLMEDCNAAFFEALTPGRMTHFSVHFHTIAMAFQSLPPRILVILAPYIQAFVAFVEDLTVKIEAIRGSKDDYEGKTIFHEIMESDIPESEKSTPRLVDEAMVFEYADGRTLVLPAGTMVGMTAPPLNKHPAWFTEPHIFNPDRYIDDPRLFKKHLTFGKGGRQCLGMNLAYQELQTFTAGIFRKYGIYDPRLKSQDGPTLELFETSIDDIRMHADYVTPGLRPGSKGVRLRIRHD